MPRKTIDYYSPYDEDSYHTHKAGVPNNSTAGVVVIYPGDLHIKQSGIYIDSGLSKVFADDDIFIGYEDGDFVCMRGWEDTNNGCFEIITAANGELILNTSALVDETNSTVHEMRRGRYLGFTTHDKNIEIVGLNLLADPGAERSAIQITGTLEDDNFELGGFFDSNGFERDTILSRTYDNAFLEIFEFNWDAPLMGRDILNRGRIGNFKLFDFGYKAEFRSIINQLTNTVGFITQPTCRFDLADTKCARDLTKYTETGTVDILANDQIGVSIDVPTTAPSHIPLGTYQDYVDPASPDNPATGVNFYDWWFKDGVITWLTGSNTGAKSDIKFYDKITWPDDPDEGIVLVVEFWESPLFEIQVGDTFSIIPGCSKTFNEGCIQKFNNEYSTSGANTFYRFGGEPFLPGDITFKVYRGN